MNEMNTPDLPELITVADVANYLGLTPQTVISFIKRGDLVATKPPGMRGYRIPRQAFEEYLAAGYQAVRDEVVETQASEPGALSQAS
ncbi:MAG: helix-turn-helix domain-containing protein [Actinomycetota bacterium]